MYLKVMTKLKVVFDGNPTPALGNTLIIHGCHTR